MTFGIIEWKDSPSSANINRSPLVLVPISLTWESINSPICLSMIDNEILLNPAIKHKFSEKFNTEILDLLPDEDIDSYFKNLRQYADAEGFSVKDEVYIGILSFSKISIYNDIDKHKDQMAAHPLIQALSGDGDGLKIQESLSIKLGEIDHDSEIRRKFSRLLMRTQASKMQSLMRKKASVSYFRGLPGQENAR